MFKLAHTKSNATVYWHLDGNYIGKSKGYHNKQIYTSIGKHKLTMVDIDGNEIIVKFEIKKTD